MDDIAPDSSMKDNMTYQGEYNSGGMHVKVDLNTGVSSLIPTGWLMSVAVIHQLYMGTESPGASQRLGHQMHGQADCKTHVFFCYFTKM